MFVKGDVRPGDRAARVPRSAACDAARFDGSAFVFVVSRDNKASAAKVTASRTSGANWVVTRASQPGDRVITQGLGNNVRQDSEVRPVPASAPQKIAPGGPGGSDGQAPAAAVSAHVADLHRPADLRLGAGDHRHARRASAR
jgi:membrane fusion protein (multidrug efflux system)